MSKKYAEKLKLVNREKKYMLDDAVKLVKETSWAKFPESVDLAIKLNLPAKKPESIRGLVSLPHGSGKSKIIAVLAKDEKAKEAKQNGADIVGAEDLIEKITKGFLDFDILLATPDMMPSVGKLGKILGTKGLMPNPKSGTVTNDIGPAVKEFKGGRVEFRMDKGGVIHLMIGKVAFDPSQIKANLLAGLAAIRKSKPSAVKGEYFKNVSISSTMGPGIKIDARELEE